MTIDEINRILHVGTLPITLSAQVEYGGIYRFIRITTDNRVFLDYDEEFDDFDGLRIMFRFESMEKMIKSIEEYLGYGIEKCSRVFENDLPEINSPADWYSLKTDLYSGNILTLKGYSEMNIGSMYWKGLFTRNLTPDSSFDELDEWIRSNME